MTLLVGVGCSEQKIPKQNLKTKTVSEKKKVELNLEKGQCVSLKRKYYNPQILKITVKGKHSWGFLEYNESNTQFSMLPKDDFFHYVKRGGIKNVECPDKRLEERKKLVEKHWAFMKNPKVYEGNNKLIEKVQVGQCVHYDTDEIGRVTAFEGRYVSITRQNKDWGKRHIDGKEYDDYRIVRRKLLESSGAISDCVSDLKKAHDQFVKN